MHDFLPMSREDMEKRGWDQCDFVYVCGDAYVDHPSFGHAIISRLLEAHGYRVGIISQPDWKNKDSITVLGEPRLGFLVIGRKHGFHGEPLFCVQKKKGKGFLYARRRHGKTARLRHGGLLQSDPVSL